MDKRDLIEQLRSQIRTAAEGASDAAAEAVSEAKVALDPTDRSSDARSAVELARMAKGQEKRRKRAMAELERLGSFRPGPFAETSSVRVGALVEIEDEDTGQSRTFFLAPAGAGATLYGPGGDGHLTVVTPFSPVGRAVMGCSVGDVVDVTLKGETREWVLTWVG